MDLSEENLNAIHFHLLNKFKTYCWISGGAIVDAIEGRTPRDIDIYFPSEKAKNQAVGKLKKEGARLIQVYPLGTKMEIDGTEVDLSFAGETQSEVFDKYDYTIVCIAIDKNGKFFCHPDFFEHLGEKKMYYTGEAPSKGAAHFTNKAKRIRKLLRKGFTMDDENLDFWLERLIVEQKRPKKQKNKQDNPV